MLSVSDATVRPDDDSPGSGGEYGSGSTMTVGPDYPASRGLGLIARRLAARFSRRLAAPVVVVCAIALVIIGVANVQVAHDRNAVERNLATARVAATRASEH